jgi:phosphoribosylformylglycinamidine cyclo-ligase
MMEQINYKDAGVDIAAGARAVESIRAAVRSTYTPEVIGDIGGFGGLYSAQVIKSMADPILVSATDGVGTKLELAKRLQNHSTVGIDLVAMCVNDIVATGAKPLYFLDYLAVGKLDESFAAEVVTGIAEGCRQAGCALIGGEMAEHPGVMQATDYDLAGFAVGVVERASMLGPMRVQAGDQIIGLASSGLHSNGYSLVRKAWTDRLSDSDLTDSYLADGTSLAEAILAPTCIYVQSVLSAQNLHAAAHITGGGITENLNRVLPNGLNAVLQLDSWPVPEVINLACRAAGLSRDEALKTFNMGIGMVVIVGEKTLCETLQHFSTQIKAYHIGSIVSADDTDSPGQVIYREGS